MAQSGMRRPFAKRQPFWRAISEAFSSLNSTVLTEVRHGTGGFCDF
jgi:hypothetical protein